MGMMSKLAKAGVAKKLVNEARKPQNQAKARATFDRMRQKQATKGGRPAAR